MVSRSCVVLVFLAACGVGTASVEGADELAAEQQGVKPFDPCATVRCAAGYECKARGKQAVCVPAPSSDRCSSDADCRTFSNYCDGCSCQALSSTQPNPVCGGTTVNCFVDPCFNSVAACVGGRCTLTTAPPAVTCGNTTCPSGQVCCNASCGICTPPDGACIQIACL